MSESALAEALIAARRAWWRWRDRKLPFDDSYDEGRQVSEREFASMTSEPYVYLPPEPFYAEGGEGE